MIKKFKTLINTYKPLIIAYVILAISLFGINKLGKSIVFIISYLSDIFQTSSLWNLITNYFFINFYFIAILQIIFYIIRIIGRKRSENKYPLLSKSMEVKSTFLFIVIISLIFTSDIHDRKIMLILGLILVIMAFILLISILNESKKLKRNKN